MRRQTFDRPRRHRRRLGGRACAAGATATMAVVALAATSSTIVAGSAQRPTVSCASGAPTHVVADGDTWFDIARSSGVSMRALLEANEAAEDRILHPDDVVCLPSGATGSSGGSASGGSYTVGSGDGWYQIAERTRTTMRALLEANDATDDRLLHPGDVLRLPDGATAPETSGPGNDDGGNGNGNSGGSYTVASGDGWYQIAHRTQTSLRALLQVNDATEDRLLHPGDVLRLPDGATAPDSAESGNGGNGGNGGPANYTVRSGDGWYQIAQRTQTTMRALLRANEATEGQLLHPGDVLRLPDGATAPDGGNGNADGNGSNTGTPLQALPVQGPCWYEDSWHAPRGAGRLHVGVDLFTTPGQYVYAVVDGTLTSRAYDQPGLRAGNAWWLTAADGSGTRFFYAHLEDFAPDLEVGSRVRAGEIIGWVGATGNAGFPHLHFEIRPNGGGPINPYPVVRAAGGCNRDTPYEQPGGWVPPSLGD